MARDHERRQLLLGEASESLSARHAFVLTTAGPALIITDLCTMRPEPVTNEFRVVTLHPGVTREDVRSATGWPIRFADDVEETPAPTAADLDVLRDLHARAAEAHGTAVSE